MIFPRRRTAPRSTLAVAAVLVVLTVLLPVGRAQGASTVTFVASADAYVQSGGPTSNYGKATVLRVRAPSPAYKSFLRFDVSGVTGPVVGAHLRLNVSDASRDGGAVYAIAAAWTETTITWNTAPAISGSPVGTIGSAPLGWIDIDLGSAIAGNGSFSFALMTSSTDSLYAASRETATPPQLVLDIGTASPSPSPSATPSSTPSSSPSGPGSAPPSTAPSSSPSGSPSTPPSTPPSSSPSPSASATPPPAAPRVFAPVADAQVKQSSPSANYGTLPTLRLRASTTDAYRTYLTFTVIGVTAPVTSARLRLFVTDASPDGGTLYTVANAWTETGITWANAPAMSGSPVAPTPGNAVVGTWIEWDVRSIVTADGTYRFGLTTSSSNSLYASSREGSSPPQLVVDTRPPDPPVAAFTANVTSGYAPLSVRFSDASTGATSWAWDVQNDGSTDTAAQNPMVTYPTAGTYSVRLTASNSVGSNTLVRDGLITVVDPPPPGPVTGVLVGAGDIADCTLPNDEATAAVLDGIAGTVFAAGDTVYESGTPAEYASCYEPTWGRHRARTLPAVGNHEYQTPGATGYYGYFGAAAGDPKKGYYSTDVGGWHVVVLNSNCGSITGGCAAGGAQETWLRADLAASSATCTVAIWHHPMFSSGSHGTNTSVRPLWAALDAAGADVVIVGHDHDYERFAPQTASGTADPAFGIRSFVVGTGGANLRAFVTTAANSEVRNSDTFRVLKLTLHASSYDWAFVPVAGSTFTDTGSTPCHGRPPTP